MLIPLRAVLTSRDCGVARSSHPLSLPKLDCCKDTIDNHHLFYSQPSKDTQRVLDN
jgi:hypothetical protein